MVIKKKHKIMTIDAAPLNLFLFLSESALSISLYIGIKEEFNAPSVKILLKILGTEKAAKKISANKPAPNDLAIRTSLQKPRTLLTNVAKLTLPENDRICLIFIKYTFKLFHLLKRLKILNILAI